MATVVEMPKLSDTMTEGTVRKWGVQVGQQVSVGDHLADVETDKAMMELDAMASGRVARIVVEENKYAPVGQGILVLADEGETVEEAAATKVEIALEVRDAGIAPAEAEVSSDPKSAWSVISFAFFEPIGSVPGYLKEGGKVALGLAAILFFGFVILPMLTGEDKPQGPSLADVIRVSLRESAVNDGAVLQLENTTNRTIKDVYIRFLNLDNNQTANHHIAKIPPMETVEVGWLEANWHIVPNEEITIMMADPGYSLVTYVTYETDRGTVGFREK